MDATSTKAFVGVKPPSLVLVFLPSSAAEIRREVKHWGDIKRLVATQCLVSSVVSPGQRSVPTRHLSACRKVGEAVGPIL